MLVLLFIMPASPWEFDEPLFFQALHRYDPVAHHPPPPGYPVFILFAQAVRALVPSDFATLVLISVVASFIGFLLLALALRNLTGDATVGVLGAVLFYFSPALLVHSTLPISEPGGLALLFGALYFWTSEADARHARRSTCFAIFAALSVGWRIQFCIFVVPLFLVAVALMRSWRERLIALGTFTVVCLLWLTPLAIAVGGIEELIRFETAQGEYLAEHDAEVSRSGWTPSRILFRFIAHAWGTKVSSFPVLIAAAFGIFALWRKRAFVPLGVAAAIYLAFALWAMDPADGVRYSIPFVLFVALAAAAGAQRIPVPPLVVAAVFAVGSLVYVSSLVSQRSSRPSPPVAAARYARAMFAPNAVALYELPLWPHATYYLRDHKPMRIDRGLAEFYERPDVPLFMYADGATSMPGAKVFRWRNSDAYSKLTRNHYRTASIIPIPPERRFKVVQGVHSSEREPGGREWRWLSSPAELALPRGPARTLTLRLGLPVLYPYPGNDSIVKVNGAEGARVRLERGKPVDVTVAIPAGSVLVRVESRISYMPARLPGSVNLDPRRLAVEMYELRTDAAAPAARQVASR